MKHTNNNWSRRKFIGSVSGTGAALLFHPLFSLAHRNDVDPRIAALIAKTIGIDAHNHLDVPFTAAAFKDQQYDLAGELKRSGFAAICMTFCVDRPALNGKGDAFDRFIISLNELDEILERNQIKRAVSFSDLQTARKKNEPIVIQSVEGGHFIEDKLERIEIAYKRGVRHLGLLHDNQSYVPLGDIYTDAPKYNGLTDLGKKVVQECNRLGILVDLTHCSNKTINDALEISSKPIIISHTGLNTQLGKNEKMAAMMMPRLISKEQAKIVANANGVIGVWTHLAETPQDYAQNILAMVDVAGIDHVCIGTDTKITAPADDRFGNKTNQSWQNTKEGFLYSTAKALWEAGCKEADLVKIMGDNYCRVFTAATKP
jgi:membrane dipeptidase